MIKIAKSGREMLELKCGKYSFAILQTLYQFCMTRGKITTTKGKLLKIPRAIQSQIYQSLETSRSIFSAL